MAKVPDYFPAAPVLPAQFANHLCYAAETRNLDSNSFSDLKMESPGLL